MSSCASKKNTISTNGLRVIPVECDTNPLPLPDDATVPREIFVRSVLQTEKALCFHKKCEALLDSEKKQREDAESNLENAELYQQYFWPVVGGSFIIGTFIGILTTLSVTK